MSPFYKHKNQATSPEFQTYFLHLLTHYYRYAQVMWTLYDWEDSGQDSFEGVADVIDRKKGYLRQRVAKALKIRFVPELRFGVDREDVDDHESEEIQRLLARIRLQEGIEGEEEWSRE